jgi:hypothetical protein
MRPTFAVLLCASVLSSMTGCNRRVFKVQQQSCDSTIPIDLEIPTQRATDILIVVDNSGSMQEEQDQLVANFLNLRIAADPDNPDVAAGECPLGDLTAIPARYRNPPASLYQGDGPLSRCGFIQLLAAFENDFRVGVITTDVGLYDNRAGRAPEGWGFRPQRGCLQPDGPARAGHELLIARKDLEDDRSDNDDFAGRFARTLENIRTFGSPYERGLDAMAIFLSETSARAPECAGDLARFRRPGAQLAVILLTDEEDCSHGLGDVTFPDELAGEPGPGVHLGLFGFPGARSCYLEIGQLSPTELYVDALERLDPEAKVALIGGLAPSARELVPGACLTGDFETECWPSGGLSNSVGDGEICSPNPSPATPELAALIAERAGRPCCAADAGGRYYELATAMQRDNKRRFLLDSICNESFRDTMIELAAFLGATNFVDLVEPPAEGLVIVTLERAGGDPEVVGRIEAERCDEETGWYLDGEVRIVFCREAIPGPGDRVLIRAKGRADSPGCVAVE